ncbi:MAG TPA: VWA domain-containing protein [Pyrinomonadaceae bacterium]|nr:VWA domain-containing protein [Pyrinomonadaceae bacterium]
MKHLIRRAATFSIMLAAALGASAQQEQDRQPAAQQDEVVRVNSELVQTDVTVVDKRGRFVEGLGREQFELKVEGRPQPVSFFERVVAGSTDEASKLAAAAGGAKEAATKEKTATPQSSERGRLIFFVVDDMHLAPDSLAHTRKSLEHFVDEQMAAGDLVAIISTSGRIGFLQQLSDNKAVLHAAIERLVSNRDTEVYAGKTPISEVDANRVQNQRDRELFAYLVEATATEYMVDAGTAAQMVKSRVREINMRTRGAEVETLGALAGLMRSSAPLAGRKLVFFISDGFVVDERKSGVPELLRRVTEEAARVGAVVYSLDARGTIGSAQVDASRNDYVDFGNRTIGRGFFDEKIPQEPLQTLAAETGGRAFLGDNDFNDAFAQAVAESSNYYLLAWRPDSDAQRAGGARVEVTVKGRPDLRVQMRRRFVGSAAGVKSKTASVKGGTNAAPTSSANTSEDELRAALASLYPLRALPVALSVGYLDTAEKGALVAASMQLDSEMLDFGEGAEAGDAKVDVWGIALDDRGSYSTFRQVLSVPRDLFTRTGQRFVLWNQQLPLPPGIYQVRVAARDRRSGRTGSQSEWIEIPGARPNAVSLSSVFVGEVRPSEAVGAQRVSVNVGRRFARGSRLRFQTFVYGAAAASPADVTVQAVVLRDGATVMTLPTASLQKNNTSDPSRLAYGGELSLEQLPPGRYVLRISASDSRTKAGASQQAAFTLE